jgi:GntR family transcriptional regulator/MocR family aminotransferase
MPVVILDYDPGKEKMRIALDRTREKPLYQQIQEFLRNEIITGALPEGTQLPSSRKLAHDLGVNRITVNNAYAELEAEGLVYSRLGSGTYVAATPVNRTKLRGMTGPSGNWPVWQQALARSSRLPTSQESERIGIEHDLPDEVIAFSRGIGAKELYPVDEFRKTIQDVLRRDRNEALGYGDRAGYPQLRRTISHILSSQGIATYPEEVLITSGSQQALVLVASLLLRPGDTVLLESPTYPYAIDIFSSLGALMIGIPVDESGMQVEMVEEYLRKAHPSLIYTIPTFQNPTGTCMSNDRRRKLISLAEHYNVPILEDEFVGDLRYEGRTHPALKTIDPGGMVIYTGTFSKMLMPTLRIGYLVASGPVYDWLLERKEMVDLATSNLVQRALEAYITVGRYELHLHRAQREYRQRRDAMVTSLRQHMPKGTQWATPRGGIFIWLRLPVDISTDDLYPIALQEKVTFTPGALFFPNEKEYAYMRLNFSIQPPEMIKEGVRRLGQAVERYRRMGSEVNEA